MSNGPHIYTILNANNKLPILLTELRNLYYAESENVLTDNQVSTSECILVGCEIECGRSYPYCPNHLDTIYGLRVSEAFANNQSIGYGVFATRKILEGHVFNQCLTGPLIVII